MKSVPAFRFNIFDFTFQIALSVSFFLMLTGLGILIPQEVLRHYRSLYYVLQIALPILTGAACWYRYQNDPVSFFSLEPIRTFKIFFGLPPIASLAILCTVFFLTQLCSQWAQHLALETALWDFGFFDQILWNTAHGSPFITSVRGGIHVFAEHFKPILILIAQIYKLSDNLWILLGLTLLFHSSCLIAVYLISLEWTRSHVTSLIFAIAVFFYQPFIYGINFLYHTQMLSDALLLFGFFCVLKRRNILAFSFFLLALSCKENIAMDVLGMGFFLIARKEKLGWPLAALALAWLALFLWVIEPNFQYAHHFRDKWTFFDGLLHPDPEKMRLFLKPNPFWYLVLVFGPFLFLSFKCKGWYWLLGPTLALRLVSSVEGLRLITAHYTGGLDALVYITAIGGFAELLKSYQSTEKKPGALSRLFFGDPALLRFVLLISVLIFAGNPQLLKIDKFLREASKPVNQRVVQILEKIPPNYSVMTHHRLAAQLTHREHLYVFYEMFDHTPLQDAAKSPDLIVMDMERNADREQRLANGWIDQGYPLILETGFVKIYANPGLTPPLSTALLSEWQEILRSQAVPYRMIFKFGYGGLVLLGIGYYLVVIIRRSFR